MKTNSTNKKVLKNIAGVTILLIVIILAFGCSRTSYDTKPNNGINGTNGVDGVDGKDADKVLKKGLLCGVYDSSVVNRSNGLITILANASPKFTKVIELFDVGDSLAANGFPKFTTAEQAMIGTEDYALDCEGYINIPVSNNYKFRVFSDDNAKLVINNNLVVNMDVLQPPTYSSLQTILLYKGLNKFNVLYFQGPLIQVALKIEFQSVISTGYTSLQVIPSELLLHINY